MEDNCKVCGKEIDCFTTCCNCGLNFCNECGDEIEGFCSNCLNEIRVKDLLDKKS